MGKSREERLRGGIPPKITAKMIPSRLPFKISNPEAEEAATEAVDDKGGGTNGEVGDCFCSVVGAIVAVDSTAGAGSSSPESSLSTY
jgi:hypothetical protein